ncbi:hypothetical protein LTR36_007264 [Oleoguttula mirabilis]|uniref:Uncharacterized protein n=1 Tax=Oleoguttula mirabilis TaxID=1507867 RepID=A0AAV9JBW4_9PEZI|nr:hypothetical protein LTR36_007264 [Oleoguttula mirabilis]
MKSSFLAVLALPALFLGAIAAPTADPKTTWGLEERGSDYSTTLTNTCAKSIQPPAAQMNSTSAQCATNGGLAVLQVSSVVVIVVEITNTMATLATSIPPTVGQVTAGLVAAVLRIVLTISFSINYAIKVFGTFGLRKTNRNPAEA